jgi:hypothetical protein
LALIRTEIFDEQLGHAVELLISAEPNSGGEFRIDLRVPKNSPALVLSVTDGEAPNAAQGPAANAIEINVQPPPGAPPTGAVLNTQARVGVLVVPNPAEGTWRISGSFRPGASITINAAAYAPTFKERLKSLPRRFACKTCGVFLKPLVVTAIVGLVMHALPAAIGASFAAAVAATLGLTIGQEFISQVIEILTGYADHPLDELVRRICQAIKAC